jgi:acetyl-CoA carboxylase carboxyltransferase component
MPPLTSDLDISSEDSTANRAAILDKIAALEALQNEAIAGGGPKYVERHRKRGKLLVRERLELLLDRDAPFLELSMLSAAETEFHTGASGVHGVGVVSGVECVITGHDPTVRGGSSNPYTLGKSLRAQDLARENRLPLINLVESGGADLPNQHQVFVPGGKWFRNLTQLSKARIPTIALVFGNSTAGGAYVPGMADYAVMVKDRAKVFLGGPPLVKMATGEESTDEELGGAEMHSRVSGLSDYLAVDEYDAIRIGRQIVRHLNWRKLGYGPTEPVADPRFDSDEILSLIPSDLKKAMDMREILARVVDDSMFDEYKREYGRSLITGWASIHGYQVGIVANQQGVLFSEEANKATEFIQLCNVYDQPLVFFHNVTGYMVGAEYEQGGIIKDGAKMVNAIANSTVPHIGIIAGASYGAGNYGMSGQAFNPRFLFMWPSAKVSVMGAEQLAGVMSIVNRAAAEARGMPLDAEQDAAIRQGIEDQIHAEEEAVFMTAHNRDDGIIDPRDTRTVLAMTLSAVHSNRVEGTTEWGVFRM